MPTGSGKSMLFQLPAFIAGGGTTIVIVPLIAGSSKSFPGIGDQLPGVGFANAEGRSEQCALDTRSCRRVGNHPLHEPAAHEASSGPDLHR